MSRNYVPWYRVQKQASLRCIYLANATRVIFPCAFAHLALLRVELYALLVYCGVIDSAGVLNSTPACIYLIQDGKVAERGTRQELMMWDGAYAGLFKGQAKYYKTA